MTRNSIENRFNKLFWGESQIQLDQLHRCGSENKLEKILDHKKVPLDKTLVDEWFKKIEHHSNKNFRISALVFLDVIYEQIRINGNECFYITNDQIKNFFSTKKNKTPPILKKINWPLRKKEGYNRPAIYVQKTISLASNYIRWKDVFVFDKNIDLNESRSSIINGKCFPPSFVNYSSNIRHRNHFRKLFLIYSTMINKTFCDGPFDLKENFLKRQKEAIESYDQIWEHLRLRDYDNTDKYYSYLFIKNHELPIPEERKSYFLQTYDLHEYDAGKNGIFEVKTSSELSYQGTGLWKFIALWLAKERYDLYQILYSKKKTENPRYKTFISTLLGLTV